MLSQWAKVTAKGQDRDGDGGKAFAWSAKPSWTSERQASSPAFCALSQVGWGQVACEGFTDNARQSRHGMEAWLAPKLSIHSCNTNS